ncbi:hypothetical protein TBLA_0E01640 [Henningerozyma blattae CBS 6284]|uniref:Uncharacterized protein n=1 Tax=Henningerozyma blattae (strain ATCC 34711 / CBS 6284 / DSM 70876 / NBRC 10599 / NRRL Y-10934 / UCD 77-7) TaxID=1071380 RepID=I2H4B9_HENB6|nr:hypothetical protein TBLA_0E01640 [Tetrapisispora blattae CBS 6284]CCH61221.1 hypothetical protein TBLA_0E01640 [Tetrapisispora blattae CBS 6284]
MSTASSTLKSSPFSQLPTEDILTVVLPRDRRWWLYYYLRFLNKSWIFRAIYITLISLLLLSWWTDSDELKVLYGFLLFFVAVFGSLISALLLSINRMKYLMGTEGQMKLLAEVTKYKPSLYIEKWDLIASHLNDYLYEMNAFPDREFFYNGKQCMHLFQGIVSTNNTLPNGSTDPEVQNFGKYLELAREVHKDSIDLYWASHYPELAIADLDQGASESNIENLDFITSK